MTTDTQEKDIQTVFTVPNSTGDVHLRVKLIEGQKSLPKYATDGSSGFDLPANQELTIKTGERALVKTGLCFDIPRGYELQVRPRSGLSLKYGVTVLNSPGTIDSDYRGELCVILINLGNGNFGITRGMRIAQAIFAQALRVNIISTDQVSATARGESGFGSTGI